ncbi:MAG: hypothetical protein GXX83_10360 [Gaiellales bacterium]|nr:hypothetical protein [Gaiellales bacterium]
MRVDTASLTTTATSVRDLERRSSAATLSDMEVFIFPELMYSLVLANIMSPRLWRWRDDPWFADLPRLTPYRRVLRLRQYIMDHYAFNLDLDTWGLTSKERELARFRGYVSPETLAQSNALFGYEGDRYYFDIDIRTHFGLDKYEGDVIPYWKTETVEAMDAFRFKPGYEAGAGECVSLAALYAAALFVVTGLPLKDIFLMATPLHSQNFLDVGEGILTNNRRLVTKAMWYNGTALSAQARRALENERVTVVAHESGWIHVLYPEATIDPAAYTLFATKLRHFLRTPLSPQILGNFVRHSSDLQKCMQVRTRRPGGERHIAMERLLAYEQGSPYRFNDETRERLLNEVEEEDFELQPLPGRLVLDDLEEFVRQEKIDILTPEGFARLKERFGATCASAADAIEGLRRFCLTEPRLPDAAAKTLTPEDTPLALDPAMSREQIIARLEAVRPHNQAADLAFYAYRDLNRTEAAPFLKAALERSPVSIAACRDLDNAAVVAAVRALAEESIYDEPGRLAQPDEVWNYGRGDGAEKAVLLANLLCARHPQLPLTLEVAPAAVTLRAGDEAYRFASSKGLHQSVWELPTDFAPR